MRFSLKAIIDGWIITLKNKSKVKKLGKVAEAKQIKKLLKQIANDAQSAFEVSNSIEKFGFRAEEERPLHLDKSVLMAVVNKTYYNGSVELSLFENEPSYPDKRVLLLLYFNSKAGNLRVLEYGGTFTDKVSDSVKSKNSASAVSIKTSKEKSASATRISK